MFSFKKKTFKVKLRGRSQIEYVENKKKLLIDSEFLYGDGGIVIYSSSMTRWNPPYENEIIDDIAKERIKTNIIDDLTRNKINVEWQ